MNRKKIIAVIGDASVQETDKKFQLAFDLGRLLIDAGYRVVTGGSGGIMMAASAGARDSGAWSPGDIIAILPGNDPEEANPAADIVIPTGMDIGRNMIVVQADAVVAIGGGAGTLSEMAMAWSMKRLMIAYRVDGWSGQLADTKIDNRQRYRDERDDRVFGVDNAFEAVGIIDEYLPLYNRRQRAAV